MKHLGGAIIKSVITRLEALEKMQAEINRKKEIERKMHEPYFVLKQWSIIEDEYILEFYPEGNFKKAEVLKMLEWEEVAEHILNYDKDVMCYISMSSSIEWLYVFYRFGNGSKYYTQEQLEDMTERWSLKYPQLIILHHTEEGRKIIEMLRNYPQESSVELKTLKAIVKGS